MGKSPTSKKDGESPCLGTSHLSEKQLHVFNLSSKQPVFSLETEEATSLKFSPCGNYLVWANRFINQPIIAQTTLFSVKDARVIRVFQHGFKKNGNEYTYF